MQKGKAVFFGIVMILVNFCIAVCIQGLLFCPISSPLQAESLAKEKPMGNLKMPIF